MPWPTKRERGQHLLDHSLDCCPKTLPTYRFGFEWIHCSAITLELIIQPICLVPVTIVAIAIDSDLLAQPCLSANLQAHTGTLVPPLPTFLPLHRSLRWLW